MTSFEEQYEYNRKMQWHHTASELLFRLLDDMAGTDETLANRVVELTNKIHGAL